MNTKTEGIIALVVALFVLFSALFDPRVSAALAVVALGGLVVYRLVRR